MRELLWSKSHPVALGLLFGFMPWTARGDGLIVDRIYDPYVQPLETEVEWRSILQFDEDADDLQKHMLGIGRSLTDRWAAELYLAGAKASGESIRIDSFELEFKWQLTEQGEYAFDWGLVFEFERETDRRISEGSVILLTARDFGRWTGLVNAGVSYEWGSGVDNEIETELHLQTRYRLRESLEPAIELHIGQDTAVLGPALTGTHRTGPARKLRWEAGAFFAVAQNSPDLVLKLNVEYEF
ncbi:MAG: hypothetical protein P8X94_01670 [Woeseiaceae bacterium]